MPSSINLPEAHRHWLDPLQDRRHRERNRLAGELVSEASTTACEGRVVCYFDLVPAPCDLSADTAYKNSTNNPTFDSHSHLHLAPYTELIPSKWIKHRPKK